MGDAVSDEIGREKIPQNSTPVAPYAPAEEEEPQPLPMIGGHNSIDVAPSIGNCSQQKR